MQKHSSRGLPCGLLFPQLFLLDTDSLYAFIVVGEASRCFKPSGTLRSAFEISMMAVQVRTVCSQNSSFCLIKVA